MNIMKQKDITSQPVDCLSSNPPVRFTVKLKTYLLPGIAAGLVFLCFNSLAATIYVNINSTNQIRPYASWSTAAKNIQDAVWSSTNGDLILVTNGIYHLNNN